METNIIVGILGAVALIVTVWANWGNNKSDQDADRKDG